MKIRGFVSMFNVFHAKIIWQRNKRIKRVPKRYSKDAGKIERFRKIL